MAPYHRIMPVYVNELIGQCSGLSTEEFGAYVRLLLFYWAKEGEMPTEEDQLARLAGFYAGLRGWKKVRPRVVELFGPNWTHPKLDVELRKKRAAGRWGEFPVAPNRCQTVEWREIRLRIFARDDWTCQYCGDRGGKLECDHKIPVSRGGTDDEANLVTACKSCNRKKWNQTIEEWLAQKGGAS